MKFHGAITLATYERPMIELACAKCGRNGRYRRGNLIDRFGADIPLPDLLKRLADCPKWGSASDPCQAVYVGLTDR